MSETKNRNAGLDLIRSIAIIFVLVQHSTVLLNPHFNILPYMKLPDGVDLFFVLSGFLVGRIIINKINSNETWTVKSFFDFIQRRWFRTLPNYFLFLILNIALVYAEITQGMVNKNLAAYFVFLQNFHVPLDLFFWESWSLAVEEWFYLLFPIMLLIFFAIGENKKIILLFSIAVFIFIPLIIRLVTANQYGNEWLTWDLYFRKLVVTRLDCIATGVLGAYINIYHSEWWNKTRFITFVGGFISLIILSTIKFSEIEFINKTFYFSLNAFAIIMLFPLTERYTNEKIPLRPLKFISNISYSVYLTHLPLMYAFIKFYPAESSKENILRYIIYLFAVGISSHLLFRFFEEPMKNLREHFSRKLR